MIDRRLFLQAGAAASATIAVPASFAQTGAATPLDNARVICGFPPGGTTDAVSRRVADKLRPNYAKVVVVDNKPGAGGRLGVEETKRSAPDGKTLLFTPASMITLYPHIYPKLAYKAEDVTPVSIGCTSVFGFGVGPAVPESVKTLKQYLEWAKANRGSASYGSPGAGTPPHFLAALLGKEAGVELVHVPYRGSAPGIQEMLGGQLPAMSSPLGDYLPHLKSGRLRLLATSGPQRSRFAPEVPTYIEQGFPDLNIVEWFGFFMPAKTPQELVDRAAAGIQAAIKDQEVIDAFALFGLEAKANTPRELAKAVEVESAAWGPVVKRVGFTAEN